MSNSLQDVKQLSANVLNRIEYLETLANQGHQKITVEDFRYQLMCIHGRLEEAMQATWSVLMKNCEIKKETRKLLGEPQD